MGTQSRPHRAEHQPGAISPQVSSLAVILLIFVALAGLHSLVVPITQGEDELAHYRYLNFIAQNGRLPANEAERRQAWYRADWPPLYHLLVGWLVRPLDTTRPPLKDVGESPRRRLVGEIFYPRLIIYTEDASWPWQDGILAWHIGRFISILFAAGALLFTYATTLELGRALAKPPPPLTAPPILNNYQLPMRSLERPNYQAKPSPPLTVSPIPLLALAVTALLAFTPRYLFTSAMLGDDSLLILLSALFIWLLLRALRGDDRWRVYAALGFVLGLSITTKYSAGLLPLALIPVIWWRAGLGGWPWPRSCGRLAWAWLWTLLGSSWWFGWIIYHFNTIKEDGLLAGLLSPVLATGPDVSMRRLFDFLGGGEFTGPIRPEAVTEGTFWGWWSYLFQTFWGVPILERDPLFPWAYLLMLLFCLVALAGLGRFWRNADAQSRATLGLLCLIVALLLPFPILRYFLTLNILETGQGRHILYPAAQASPLLLMLGWSGIISWLRQRHAEPESNSARQTSPQPPPASPKVFSILPRAPLRFTFYVLRFSSFLIPHSSFLILFPPLLLLAWSIFQIVFMAYAYPQPLPVQTTTFDPASIPQPLKHRFGDEIQFLGYDFQPDPEQATPGKQPGAIVNLTLFWQALQPADENYRTLVQLVDPAGRPRLTWLSHPLNGRYPTRAWDQGDVIRDTLPLPLAGMPAGAYDIQIDLWREAEDVAPSLDGAMTGEPLQIIHFDLGKTQPIAGASVLGDFEVRLWLADQPVRYRQTIPLSWARRSRPDDSARAGQRPAWALVGPDGVARQPASLSEATAMFIVGADWPSGPYRLGLADGALQTDELFTLANDLRRFDVPADLAAQPGWRPVEANFADQIELLGYILPDRRLKVGSSLPLTLAWRGLAPVLPDALTFAVLLDANQQAYSQVDRYPSGFYSPMLWAENEVVVDAFSLPIPPDTPPGIYVVHLGQYQVVAGRPGSLPLAHAGRATPETAETAVVIGPFKVGGPPPAVTTQEARPQVRLDQPLGDQLTLLGYDLGDQDNRPVAGQTAPPPGQNPESPVSSLKVTLYWQVRGDPGLDYTTFLHLRNDANETVAQKDSPPAGGRYPTSLWEAGEIIVDEIILPLNQVAPGNYTPVVGLYELASGNRLLTPGLPANEVALQPIHIEE
jgi:hypothetical protein